MTSPSDKEQITEHRAWLAGIAEEGLALFSDLGNLLSEVDELLLKSDEVLNYSQPPMDGKLGIRFWKRHRPDKLEPVVVVWQKSSRTGRFRPKQVSQAILARGAGGIDMQPVRLPGTGILMRLIARGDVANPLATRPPAQVARHTVPPLSRWP